MAELVDRGAESQVGGAEIMAPLRDTMRLVHHEELGFGLGEDAAEGRIDEALRGDIGEFVLALADGAQRLAQLAVGERGIDHRHFDAEGAQFLHLILHQRDQRRDHHRRAAERDRRQLVGEAFATAGGQDCEHIAPRQHGPQHLGLAGPETPDAEALAGDLPQLLQGGVERRGLHRSQNRHVLRTRSAIRPIPVSIGCARCGR